MKGLGGLVALAVLYLYNTQVGGDVKGLGGLVALTELSLYSCTKVGGDVEGLGGLVALTKLDLDDTQVQNVISRSCVKLR